MDLGGRDFCQERRIKRLQQLIIQRGRTNKGREKRKRVIDKLICIEWCLTHCQDVIICMFYTTQLYICTSYVSYHIYLYKYMGGTWEQDKFKCHKAHCFDEVQSFFLNKCFSSCCTTSGNFQSSENIGSDCFCQRSHCFYQRADFQKPSLCHCGKWSLGSQCFLSVCIHCIAHSSLAGSHRKTLSLFSQTAGYSFLYVIVFEQV